MSCSSMRLPTAAARLLQFNRQIADALQVDDELEARQQFAGLVFVHLGDDRSHSLIDHAIERIEFLLALADSVRQRRHAGSYTLGDNSSSNPGQTSRLAESARAALRRSRPELEWRNSAELMLSSHGVSRNQHRM